jgi:hypothetical protein
MTSRRRVIALAAVAASTVLLLSGCFPIGHALTSSKNVSCTALGSAVREDTTYFTDAQSAADPATAADDYQQFHDHFAPKVASIENPDVKKAGQRVADASAALADALRTADPNASDAPPAVSDGFTELQQSLDDLQSFCLTSTSGGQQ